MKKIKQQSNHLIRMVALLALLLVGVNVSAKRLDATFQAPASQGQWDGETNTYSWTQSYSNLMPIFTFDNGQLASYTKLHLTTSNYTDGQAYRVCFMNGSTAVATIAFYSAGEKNLVFAERSETKDIDLSKITSIQFGGNQDSNSGSIGLDPSSVYLEGPDPSYTVSITRTNIPAGCDAWFTLGSDPAKYTTSKVGVPVGTQVHFYASADGNDNKDVNGWRKTGTHWTQNEGDPGWIGWTRDFVTTIRETAAGTSGEAWLEGNIDLTPEFKDAYTLRLTVGEGGSAVMYETGDVNKVSLSGRKSSSYPSPSLTFEAKPNPGYDFVGWFENGSGTAANSDLSWTKGTYTASPMASLNVEARFVANGAKHTVTFSTPKPFGQVPLPEGILTAKIKNTETVVNSGDEVPEGTIITFTALNFSDNAIYEKEDFPTIEAGRMVLTGWKLNGGDEFSTNIATSGIVWKGSTTSYDVTVSSDINFQAIYYLSYVCKMQEATGGSAIAKIGEHTIGDDAAFRSNTDVQLIATPASGYEFDHWEAKLNGASGTAVWSNPNWSTANPFVFTATGTTFDRADGLDIIVTPVFRIPEKLVTADLYCNQYVKGDGTKHNGSNNFGAHTLNASPNAESSSYDAGTGFTITTGADGGYAYYKFSSKKNFSDLAGWSIGADDPANVSNIAFYKEGVKIRDYYTTPTNRHDITADQKNELKEVDEIRINLVENTTTVLSFANFNFEHADRTTPTLKDGTEPDMSIYETTSLVLSNSPGYWRQFTNGEYGVVKTADAGGLIPNGEWKSYYKFDNMQLGDYYFGARDGGTCALGYTHETELVKVHVNVKALDIIGDINTTKNGGDKEGSSTTNKKAYSKNVTVDGNPVTVKVDVLNTSDECNTCEGVILSKDLGTELYVNAPNGYRIQKVDVTFGESTKYNVSMNRGNMVLEGEGNSITYTNLSEYDYVRMVVRNEATEEQKVVHVTNVKVYLVPVNMKIIDESRDINVEGVDRKYWLYVPENVKNGENKNVPVVFALHGGGEDYEPTHSGQLNFNSLADANNFIVVYPRAAEHYFYHFNGAKARAWEATGAENNDTKLFEAIIEALKAETKDFTIDENKVYMAGFSVGGMMAYATANVLSDKFAAFASISGLPMNEVHLRTHGERPVPFLHVHGTKDNFVRYEHMATIVDNMLTRNGLSYTPTATAEGDADIWSDTGKTRYKKYAYGDEQTGASSKSGYPYIYYQIGTGMTAGDTGMGHNHWCNIGGKDVKQVMWEFFYGRSLQAKPAQQSYFKAQIKLAKPTGDDAATLEAGNQLARDHGWNVPTQGSSFGGTRLLAQYGESGGYSVTDENVYHTIQLPEKETHYLKLNAKGGAAGSFINVRIVKLGDVNTYFDKIPDEYVPGQRDVTFPITEDVVLDKNYDTNYSAEASNICIAFSTAGKGVGEYRIILTKSGLDDAITIDGISIDNFGTPNGHEHEGKLDTDFDGFFSYNNRLCAQWNFDLSDPFRFNVEKVKASIAANAGYWKANYENTNTGNAGATMGTVIYTYTGADLVDLGADTDLKNYSELTYDGTNKVPVTAGLMFKADEAGHVSIQVTLSNGKPVGTQLVVDQHVKMYIPYVENSYRPDNGFGGQVNEKESSAEGAAVKEAALPKYYDNCLHHHKRDIIYMSLANGSVWDVWKGYWDHGHVINKCIDDPEQELFHSGGEEFINDKKYYKMNYLGKQGVPCIMQFRDQTIIDRIGVNRNLTYSFYSEYISELGMTVPQPRTRIVGSPKGLKVANIGDSEGKYGDCIALTYGGWPDDRQGYYAYVPYDGHENTLDRWKELGVYNGGEQFYTWANMPEPTKDIDVPIATDGFPVFSRIDEPAHSETVMASTTQNVVHIVKPAEKDKDGKVIVDAKDEYLPSYHPANDGNIITGGYQPNVTPWSLPCRGAYLKFEPSRPGVLNVHILQRAFVTDRDNNLGSTKATYYIADEFGNLINSESVYRKTAMKGRDGINVVNGGFQINDDHSDYAKYSFNVYPGKTYYMFSNDAGIGMTGFYYEPDVYRYETEADATAAGKDWELGRRDVTMKEVNLNTVDGDPYSVPTTDISGNPISGKENLESPNGTGGNVIYPIEYSEKAVTVNITRHFNKDEWNSICLPFSLNQVEMESVFGKGTSVIMLRDVQPGYRMPDGLTTLNYIYHENQDIIAGYPYLIKPTKEVNKITANVCLSSTTPSLVSIDSKGPLTVPSFTEGGTTYTDYDGIDAWTFVGTFETKILSPGSMAMSGGSLSYWKENVTLKPYRVSMDIKGGWTPETAAKITRFSTALDFVESDFSEIPTGIDIDQCLEEQGIFVGGADVYSIDGKKIRTNVTSLKSLPKGMYIINKKKYIVR